MNASVIGSSLHNNDKTDLYSLVRIIIGSCTGLNFFLGRVPIECLENKNLIKRKIPL